MRSYDSIQHVKGESKFVDDLIQPDGTLFGAVYYSPIARGKILKTDFKETLKIPGVYSVITASDIPGENQIGGVILDEELFSSGHLHFVGQPIALILAGDRVSANKGVKAVKAEYEKLKPVLNPREAFAKGDLIVPPRIFSLGDIDSAWGKCDYIIDGLVESGSQEHLYLETQGALAIPAEGGGIKIISSTQGPTAVQKIASRVLNLPMNKIEVDVPRLGGGFGGKEDQATAWAVMAALSALKTGRPVKIILPRQEDMRMTGKRHPYSSDFKIGLNKDGKILAYQAWYYQNAGASADLSTAILERTLFHSTNSYYIPNVKATAYCCRTNLPPFTAFRGFGGPQAMFVIESAIHKAAEVMGVDPSFIQRNNLLKEGNEFPYGQRTENCRAEICFEETVKKFNYESEKKRIEKFNAGNSLFKKGIALMPVCFGISFTTTFLNQASALVHVYTDGSIRISTAAVEMGQGVNTKLTAVASRIFSINPDRIKIDTTNTSRVANTSPTAASKGADLNGYATINACSLILERLKKVAKEKLRTGKSSVVEIKDEFVYVNSEKTDLDWVKLINMAYVERISLTAQAHHATPNIYFDREKMKGDAFAYHVFGTALVEATVDCLRGTYVIDSVKVVHDFGKSLHPVTDRGQAEGAIVQGLGWMTLEELIYNEEGKLLTDALSTYKIPDINFAPKLLEVHFLEDVPNPYGPFQSKAVGEPPFMYGIGAYFAIANAMKAFLPGKSVCYNAPVTNEKVLMWLHSND
ncbi:MAG TPA: molybdopterin-dependent oxidoreductase [Melioribacteraceae bacterium]|nr:molybdopterin-dependent oxidoreductase [Melioribacteraceae bacterium]